MTATLPEESPPIACPLDPFSAWWTLLLVQLERARLSLPKDLVGVVQFESSGKSPRFVHLRLAGSRTEGFEGVAPSPDAWIHADEEALAGFLHGAALAPGSLRMVGDASLVRRLFDALDTEKKKTNWLGVRVDRSPAGKGKQR